MIRCLKADFKTSKENLDKLFACNRISAMIWNKCLQLSKEYREAICSEKIVGTRTRRSTVGK